VWSERGYPSRPPYRDSHRFTEYRHRAWAIDGAVYDGAAAERQARADARDFVQRARGVCAFDTELLGHFWHEGPAWLAAVLEEAGDDLHPLDELLRDAEPAPAGLAPTSWGSSRDLSTWSGPAAGGLAWGQRSAELRMAGAPERALRELLALQSSDWAFLIARGTAGDYPRERFEGHRTAFEAALRGELDGPLRNLAPHMVTP
jgi:1,4-alpha-glucan branching enzyme